MSQQPRYFPRSFSFAGRGEPCALPLPKVVWHSLASIAELFLPTSGVMLIAPPYWQLEPAFHETLHAQGIPIAFMHGGNMPVAVEVMRQTNMRGVVVASEYLEAFLTESVGRRYLPELQFVLAVTPIGQYHPFHPPALSQQLTIFHEIHITPGCPLLYQTPVYAGSNHYCGNADFTFHLADSGASLRAQTAQPFPCDHLSLPFSLVKDNDSFSIL